MKKVVNPVLSYFTVNEETYSEFINGIEDKTLKNAVYVKYNYFQKFYRSDNDQFALKPFDFP